MTQRRDSKPPDCTFQVSKTVQLRTPVGLSIDIHDSMRDHPELAFDLQRDATHYRLAVTVPSYDVREARRLCLQLALDLAYHSGGHSLEITRSDEDLTTAEFVSWTNRGTGFRLLVSVFPRRSDDGPGADDEKASSVRNA